MLGLLLDIVKNIPMRIPDNYGADLYSSAWSHVNSGSKKKAETPTREEKRKTRLRQIKYQRLGKGDLENFNRTGTIHYAPPYSDKEQEEHDGHKIMYIAYEWDAKGESITNIPSRSFVFSLPAGITDGVSTEWDDESSAIKRIMASTMGADEDRGLMRTVGEEMGRIVDSVGLSFERGKAGFVFQDFYFKSVTKREFSFSHKMTPQNEDQSIEMKRIVDWIQTFASPSKIGNGNTRLRSPAQWDIHFLSEGTDNPFLPKIGKCVLESVSINSTPNDSFQPSLNNYPNDVDIELSFKEINIRTADDIKTNSLTVR